MTRLGCGCELDEVDGELVVRPCCEAHADWLLLRAIEHGLAAGGIEYR